MTTHDYDAAPDPVRLRERVGTYHYRHRLAVQRYSTSRMFGPGRTWMHPENIHHVKTVLNVLFWMTGLHPAASAQARNIRLRENVIRLPGLPAGFQGRRILHLSDLHIDLDDRLAEALLARVRGTDYDWCVITGDFRASTHGPMAPALAQLARLMELLHGPVYGVLGNHDFLEMLPGLEALGIRMLVNESEALTRDGGTLYLVGIDDPHFYEAENMEKALDGIPDDAPKILLSHSAESYREALAAGIHYMLCGHTHAGQICLPWGRPLFFNVRQPRRMLQGPWTCHELQGYTSAGAGCSIAPLRLFAPPEITLHTLERGA